VFIVSGVSPVLQQPADLNGSFKERSDRKDATQFVGGDGG